MVKITSVEKRSKAEKAGILSSDILVSINGNEINDVLDYRFYLTEKDISLSFTRGEKNYSVRIKKGEYDDIGLDFETPLMDKKHSCKNGCIFCFIDQNPEGLRDTLYFKDDDSRLSFLHGNYITLTNMTEKDVDRIIKMRFSPINISVHTTNPDLRVKMMKNKRAGEVLSYLDSFVSAGIDLALQIVLCKGINDGEELERTLSDLSRYYPRVTSIAVVPAGLTKHRDKLYPLSDFTKKEACEVIDLIDRFGEENKAKFGTRLCFAADEFYLKAGRVIPDCTYYEDYLQLENGVGMLRSFSDEFFMALDDNAEYKLRRQRTVSVVTGSASYPMMQELCNEIMRKHSKLSINIYKITNNFFGESITVSGLITGKDIVEQLKDKELGDLLLIPDNALRECDDDFLCGMTLSELSDKLAVKAERSGADGYEFLEKLLGI